MKRMVKCSSQPQYTKEEILKRLEEFQNGWSKPDAAYSDFWADVIRLIEDPSAFSSEVETSIECAEDGRNTWSELMTTSKSWTDFLQKVEPSVYGRLCACRNTKSDLPILVDTTWAWFQYKGKDKKGFTKEDALVQVLEWLDSNDQWELADLDESEYQDLIR